MAQSDTLLELRDVDFAYGERLILSKLSMRIPRGQVVAVMGGSGCGKTTVLRLIGGLVRAARGEVLFQGRDIGQLDHDELYAARRKMGMLFQFGALFTDMSVFENVAFPLREHTDLPEALLRDLVLMKLNAVGLRGARDLSPGEISGIGLKPQGQGAQQSGFARAGLADHAQHFTGIEIEADILAADPAAIELAQLADFQQGVQHAGSWCVAIGVVVCVVTPSASCSARCSWQ